MMNTSAIRWWVCALLASGAGCAVDPEAPPLEGISHSEGALSSSDWGAQTVARAQQWVDAGVWYSHDVGYAGYRTDCSGYVSWIWRLPAPGDLTWEFAGGSDDDGRSIRLASFDDLRPGDALNYPGVPYVSGHIMLFDRWDDASHQTFWSYEEVNPSAPARHVHHSMDDQWNPDDAPGATIRDIYVPIRAASRPDASGGGSPAPAPGGAWSCGDSAYGGRQYWTCAGAARVRCDAAGRVEREACQFGCDGRAVGTDDYCRSAAWTCDRSAYAGRQYWTCFHGEVLRCVDGDVPVKVHCAHGCTPGPVGTDDHCD